MTMQFHPSSRRIECIGSDGKQFLCTPEMLINLDQDLGETARRAIANPSEVFTVKESPKRRSIAA
jgi:hypothetical protein